MLSSFKYFLSLSSHQYLLPCILIGERLSLRTKTKPNQNQNQDPNQDQDKD